LDSIDETKIRSALASRLERGGAANYKYLQESIRCCDIFGLAIADKWSQPKDLAHVTNLSGSSIQNQTGADKARLMAEHMFPRYSEMTVPPETLPTTDEFLSRAPMWPFSERQAEERFVSLQDITDHVSGTALHVFEERC